jgi:uncharacterized protein YyaL (SSP411 family)
LRFRSTLGFVATLILLGVSTAAQAAGAAQSGPANRLAKEASPYLQLHAHNPVDWYPWGEEAFARARAEQKPIFLSVGYSTCYWCHVMERKVFSNPEIAARMNQEFINVKVDREERPDIDEIYMTATQLLTGRGGWPNSVFLTPEGDPFFAGTYFGPSDTGTRPGFARLIDELADSWKTQRDQVRASAARVRKRIQASAAALPTGSASFEAQALLARATRELQTSYEPTHGGFSQRTKFPSPAKLALLLASHETDPASSALDMLTHTLDEMALGGIYDHVGGGFHRYSTEPSWSIPHYEKMLYDNAQLLGVYARAYRVTKRPLYRDVALGIVSYLEREMRHPEGAFYSAQDAETDGHEGKSYLWTAAEIQHVLGAERAAAFLDVYQLVPMPEGEGRALRVALPIEPALAKSGAKTPSALLDRFGKDRAKLLAARDERPQPLRDEKVLASWNGLLIRGLVDAGLALGRPDYVRLAEASADQVLARLDGEGERLHRSYVGGQVREAGLLDDHAYLADGLLALHRASGDPTRLAQARSLADRMLDAFEDPKAGGFYLTRASTELIARPRSVYDGVEPSGSGVALRVLRELGALTREPKYAEATARTVQAFSGVFEKKPSAVGTAVVSLQQDAGAESRIAQAEGLPRSSQHVTVSARRSGSGSAIVVRIGIDDGFHINANPASSKFFVATTVEVEGATLAAPIPYPPGVMYSPQFTPEAISTYKGSVEIPIPLDIANAATAEHIVVRYQACDETRCLAPSTSTLAVP